MGWLAFAGHPFSYIIYLMKLFKQLFLILFAATFAVSCSDDASDSAKLTATTTELSNEEGKVSISISTDGSWVISSSATWLSLSAEYGTEENTVIVATVKANANAEQRSATVTLKSGSASDAITFNQAGGYVEVYRGLELPAQNSNNYFVSHYAEVNGKQAINYSVEWNNSMKHAEWVAFFFDKYNSQDNVERLDNFQVDPDLPEAMQIDNSYFTNDGFDRGHLCAAADRHYSSETMDQTFYFSNMSPQLNPFNAGIWQRLEEEVQDWGRSTTTGKFDTVFVAKGGTLNNLLKNFTGSKAGSDKVVPTTDETGFTIKGLACPAYYFMAILSVKNGSYQAIGFILPHSDTLSPIAGGSSYTVADLKKYAVSIDELEKQTNLDFFCNLSDDVESEVEASLDLDAWNW